MKKQRYFLITAALVVPLLFGTGAQAAENTQSRGSKFAMFRKGESETPTVVGVVSSVGSSTITVESKDNTSYIIDTENAKITKGLGHTAITLSLADIKSGDEVAVFGKVSGTSVAATSVVDEVRGAKLKHKTHRAKHLKN